MDVVDIEDLLVTPQAAVYVGVQAHYLRRLAAAGRGPVPAVRRGRGGGGGTFYTRAELDRWNASRRRRTTRGDA